MPHQLNLFLEEDRAISSPSAAVDSGGDVVAEGSDRQGNSLQHHASDLSTTKIDVDGGLSTPEITPPGSLLRQDLFPPSPPASGGKLRIPKQVTVSAESVQQQLVDLFGLKGRAQVQDISFPRSLFERALSVLQSADWETWYSLTEKQRCFIPARQKT